MSAPAPASFCWFDYETFGTSPAWDRPAQFAAVRTDVELNEIGEPLVLHCRQSDDYLPHPAACRVTGLAPDALGEDVLPEHRFIETIRASLGAPGTCSVGYNSIRFDDEFTRHTLFRNLHDPYAHEWRDGASRWDLLDVVRLTRALRPEGIEWPVFDGRPSNRLEHLSAANALAAGRAHDALVDVRATIALAALIRRHQPRLFAHALAHRDKRSARALLDLERREPVILVSSAIPPARHHLALVVPIAPHPSNPNAIVVLDLAHDPDAFADLDAQEIGARVFARGVPADDPSRVGLHAVAVNRCPVLVPRAALRAADAERLDIDLARADAHLDALERRLDASLRVRVRDAFSRPADDAAAPDVDASLYTGGFLSAADRARLDAVRAADPAAIGALDIGFADPRLPEMLFRYRARNHPDTLDAAERERWAAHVRQRLEAGEDAPWLGIAGFERAMAEQDWRPEEAPLRESLARYAATLAGRIGREPVLCADHPRP